jgi:acyl dehydratase
MNKYIDYELPPFERASDFAAWNRYAAVNDEFIPIHMDDEAGRAAGFQSAFGMGNLQVAYLHAVLREWMQDEGRVMSLTCQMRAPNLRGTLTTATGKIIKVSDEGDDTVVEIEVATRTEDGTILSQGVAKVAFANVQ